MSRKTLAVMLSAIMLTGVLAGCGDSNPTENMPASTDKTESQSVNTDTQQESSQVITVPVTIVNNTQVEIYELYTSGSGVEEWGNNIIPSGQKLSPGTQLSQISFSIDKDNLKWDLLAVDSDGNQLEFYGLDLSQCNTSGITISLSYDSNTQTGLITAQ